MQDEHLEVSVDQDTVVLNLGSGDEPCTLYLTFDEARSLASEMEGDLLAGQGDAIVVCDVPIERSNAWNVILTVEAALASDAWEKSESLSSHSPHRANWLVEGF